MRKLAMFKLLGVIFILIASFVSATWTPPSDVDLRNAYNLYNISNATLIGTLSGGDITSTVNETTYWAGVSDYQSRWFYDDSNNLTLNETLLNETIEALDNDTKYTAGLGLILTSTVFSWNDTYGNNTYIQWNNESSLNVNQCDFWDSLNTPSDITSLGTIATGVWQATQIVDAYIASLNASKLFNIAYLNNKTTIAAANITDPNNLADTHTHNSTNITSQDLMNVNRSTYWDSETSQADLNVNRSDFWDSLNTSSDITSVGTLTSLIVSGDVNLNLNWTYLQNYPATCSGSEFVRTIGDTLTCAADQEGVTSVAAGNGLDFTTITSTGSVTMGTPGTLSDSSSNAVTATSHTHDISDVYVLNSGDNMTGNLTMESSSIKMNDNYKICMNSNCSSWVCHNGSALILNNGATGVTC